MKIPTFNDLICFIILNKGDTFKEYENEQQIASACLTALNDGLLYYHVSRYGIIDGMIMAEKRPNNILFVIENLAMNMSNLKDFARRSQLEFKGYKLEWLKHGIYKHHNTVAVYKKLKAI